VGHDAWRWGWPRSSAEDAGDPPLKDDISIALVPAGV